jgi:predicted transposase YbfD/YdcC
LLPSAVESGDNQYLLRVLLITLDKQGKSEDHKYLDHWIDDNTFHWQSQNATTPDSSKGKRIIAHQKDGWKIHLFVRETKLNQGTAGRRQLS